MSYLELEAIGIRISDREAFEAKVDSLLKSNELRPISGPPSQPAFSLRAKLEGTAGNKIQAIIERETGAETFSLRVQMTERYPGIILDDAESPNYIETLLESSDLVNVTPPTSGIYAIPRDYPGIEDDELDRLPLEDGEEGVAATADALQPDSSDVAFTLTAKDEGAHGDHISATIVVDDGDVSFTLVVQMIEEYETLHTDPDDENYVGDQLEENSYLVEFVKSGASVLPPTSGTYSLSGGEDARIASTHVIG